MKQDAPNANIDLLFEVGSLRRLPRQWCQFVDYPVANVAEHTFRVLWIAWILALKEGADCGKVLALGLLHDLAESRCGDRNYVQRQYTSNKEGEAVTDALMHTTLAGITSSTINELIEGNSIEYKIVKDADNLDVDIELMEMKASGHLFPAAIKETRELVFSRLHTESARQLFRDIQSGDMHAWHLRARNRMNSGDWSK